MTDAVEPTPPAASGQIRISQVEREATVVRLHRALQEGRLELSEVEERTAAAYASRHQSDLAMFVADLPPDTPSGWRQVGRAVIVQTWTSIPSPSTVRRPAGQGGCAPFHGGSACCWPHCSPR